VIDITNNQRHRQQLVSCPLDLTTHRDQLAKRVTPRLSLYDIIYQFPRILSRYRSPLFLTFLQTLDKQHTGTT
jgi:hypothetical protein